MAEIVFDNVVFRYPYCEYDAVEGLSLTLSNGWTDVLIDTQSGKTTLCKLLMGLEKPNSGLITYNGRNIDTLSFQERNILYLGKQNMLFDNKSVLVNVEYPMKVRGVGRAERRKIALDSLVKCNLEKYADTKVKHLPEDVRHAVSVCRALTRNVDLVLCDDFFDSDTTIALQLLKDNFFDTTLVNFTSQIDKCVGEFTLLIKDGKVVAEGDRQHVDEQLRNILWLAREV